MLCRDAAGDDVGEVESETGDASAVHCDYCVLWRDDGGRVRRRCYFGCVPLIVLYIVYYVHGSWIGIGIWNNNV